ncbi:MAG TPA: GNAT family N-acetyltransferase [Nocardioidaceae bacterium]|nr:GNAT family N-acetyltransferase [Nocardioidaceae bacterium]
MATEVQLRDGTRAFTWRLLPGDREAIREGYELLSPDAQFHRFLAPVPHLTDAMLDRLVDDVDGVEHVALVLFVMEADVGIPAGVGRIIRYSEDPKAADVAVTVLEEFQGRGVASALLQELLRERPVGVERIVTEVAADNPASLAMLRRLGATTVTTNGGNMLHVIVELAAPASPGTPQPSVDRPSGS